MNIKLAAMGDLHFGTGSLKTYSALFKSVNKDAEAIVLCGDLTTRGLIEEARGLAEALSNAEIPVIAVLGKHNIGFAGTKGFCGGFLNCRIAPFGEHILKMFINETFKEANKVNRALKNMKADFKVIAYHYSPVRDTCIGEHAEVIPFLGCSILSDPAETFKANLILHGHAHNGMEKGQTISGIPVRNVALPIHNKKYVVYDTTAFRLEP